MDDTLETTKSAIESVIALTVGDRLSHHLSWHRRWEVDFVRFCLGLTKALEERQFNAITQDHNR